jgi:hypothetical protein
MPKVEVYTVSKQYGVMKKKILTAYVINLDHRIDRWESMQKEWSHIFRLHRVSAVKSRRKYLGCAQSHINSIRLAFSSFPYQSHCIVLEDDVKPLRSRDYFESLLEKLSRDDFGLDCVSLNSTFDRKVTTEKFKTLASLNFLLIDPNTYLMSGTSFMIYSRRVLDRMDEYQRHLETSSFIIPNDRLFSTSVYGIYKFSPLTCAMPQEQVCDLSELAAVSDNYGGGIYDNHANNLDSLKTNSNPPIVISLVGSASSQRLDIRLRPIYLALFIGLACLAVLLVLVVSRFKRKTSSIIPVSAQGSLI